MMYCTVTGGSTWENLLQLLGLAIVFVLILIATYYTTKWIGKNSVNQPHANNINVVETFRLSQNKYIQIVKAGKDKYLVIAVSKDSVEFLTELSEDELDFTKPDKQGVISFTEVLKKVSKDTMSRLKNNKLK